MLQLLGIIKSARFVWPSFIQDALGVFSQIAFQSFAFSSLDCVLKPSKLDIKAQQIMIHIFGMCKCKLPSQGAYVDPSGRGCTPRLLLTAPCRAPACPCAVFFMLVFVVYFFVYGMLKTPRSERWQLWRSYLRNRAFLSMSLVVFVSYPVSL